MIKNILLIISLLVSYCFTIGKITVENTQTHNKNCYTQGLFFLNDTHIFQSCGLYQRSYFHVVQYQSTPFQLQQAYSTAVPWKFNIFLEGATLFKGFIYLLTWQERVVYKLNATTFQIVKQISWSKDGWGLTTNGTHMFTTDGSANIYLVDENFTILSERKIKAYSSGYQEYINQLQFVGGYIYANIYMDRKIVKIDYQAAQVVYQYDGSNLVEMQKGLKSDEVLNGIAYDKTSGKFILTGKDWSKVYQVSLSKAEGNLLIYLLLSLLFLWSL